MISYLSNRKSINGNQVFNEFFKLNVYFKDTVQFWSFPQTWCSFEDPFHLYPWIYVINIFLLFVFCVNDLLIWKCCATKYRIRSQHQWSCALSLRAQSWIMQYAHALHHAVNDKLGNIHNQHCVACCAIFSNEQIIYANANNKKILILKPIG